LKNLKINLDKMIGLRGVSLAIVGSLLIGGLSGCAKKADCSVEGNHAHLYTSDEGYSTYYNKEYLTYDGYERQEEYIPLTEEEVDLYKFLDKKDLISLSDNLEVILAQQEQNQDYVEYRYSYKKRVTRMGGKVPVRRTVTRYSWTSDPNHSDLTGETRVCHYVYQACNVYKDEHGKYVVIPSEYVDDINDLVGEYTYVRKIYYKVINLENNLEVDYEDGQEESYDAVKQSNVADTVEYENGPKLVKTY